MSSAISYLDQLKHLNVKTQKVKHESKEAILLENTKHLSELFVEANEIESIPAGPKRDAQILRLGIIAEMDASNLYEKLALLAQNKKVKKTLLDVSREEKVHFGEFEELLEIVDPEFDKAEEEGEEEVKEK